MGRIDSLFVGTPVVGSVVVGSCVGNSDGNTVGSDDGCDVVGLMEG